MVNTRSSEATGHPTTRSTDDQTRRTAAARQRRDTEAANPAPTPSTSVEDAQPPLTQSPTGLGVLPLLTAARGTTTVTEPSTFAKPTPTQLPTGLGVHPLLTAARGLVAARDALTSSGETSLETGTVETSTAATTEDQTAPEKRKSDITVVGGRPTAPRTTSSSRSRRREILKAKEELLTKQAELAALRVAILEEDSEDELESVATEREARVRSWVQQHPNPPAILPPEEIPRGEQAPPIAMNTHDEPEGPTRTQKNEYSGLALAIAEAARAMQPSVVVQRKTPELPVFNGTSGEWLPFKAAFEQTANTTTEQENLARLRRSLKGAAREATQCLFIGSTTTQEVMKLLAARFGRPDALVMAEMEKLKTLPRLSDAPRDICLFASQVTNITATVKALNKIHYLYNPGVVNAIVEKLPATLRYRYYDFVTEQPEDEPDLMKITKFLERTAERCGAFAPAECLTEHSPKSNPRRPARTYHTDDRPTPQPEKNSCPICKKTGHYAATCSTFKEATTNERWDMACKERLCFRCLGIRRFRHMCKYKKCGIDDCSHAHHHLLHNPRTAPMKIEPAAERTSTAVMSAAHKRNKSTLLKILKVQVSGPAGVHDTYALLDDGSTCTLIDENTAEKIGASGPEAPLFIEGVAGARVEAIRSRRIHFSISGNSSRERFNISARTMDQLNLAPQTISKEDVMNCPHLKDIEEDVVYEEGTPTILIGQDNWHLLLTDETRRGSRSQPVASRTQLGWVLHGTRHHYPSKTYTQRIHHITAGTDNEIEQLMKEHFSLEALGIAQKKSITEAEQRAIKQLEENTKRLPAGGFETSLLWKSDNPKIPASYDAALHRLQGIERKLDRDAELKKRYNRQIEVLLENNFAERAPEKKNQRLWYLPHFAVINPAKPEKLRIVHDAAARSRGTALNDLLLSGPDLLQSLPGVLIRFRQRPVAVTADIKDMFLRVDIHEQDRDMQRFLWRGDRREGPPEEFRMKSVIFGATSSPCTAIYVKNRNAEDLREKYPEASEAVIKNHYMDDFLGSFDNEEEALKISNQVALIHSHANFFLQRWASNSRYVIGNIAPGQTEEKVVLDPEKILGMVWRPEPDTLSFNVNEHKIPTDILTGASTPTKRQALRTVMSLFDPLGLATPVTIQAKRIIQETWRSGIGWDDPIAESENQIWRRWMEHVRRLPNLAVPRCHPQLSRAKTTELHTFVDASSTSYAGAVYWRVEDEEGRVHTSLVIAKARVAPVNKVTSVPRLELQAALLGTRLARTAMDEHDLKPDRRVFWSDSRTVLAWLRTGPRAFKPFVAHRVAEIAEETKTTEWRWVPTKLNVADDATRDTPEDFSSDHRWFRGPEYLYLKEEDWPRENKDTIEDEVTGEERVNTTSKAATRLTEALPNLQRFSSYLRAMRATARILQFIDLVRPGERCAANYKRTKKNKVHDPDWRTNKAAGPTKTSTRVRSRTGVPNFIPIEARHMHQAELLWVRAQQQELFEEESRAIRQGVPVSATSRLRLLALTIDSEGVMRLKSRIDVAQDITEEQKAPAVIDGHHRWTQLYVHWVHSRLHHGGFNITANEVRQHYWVLRLRNTVRQEIQKCQSCRIRRATPAQPSTGNHPPSRLAHHQRPFTYTGLDYFGPITVTVGRGRQKRYGVLFTCLTTRAVHLEVAHSLTTDSAIMALRRFIARRGCPTELWSDQGTNLKGADVEMKKAAREAMEQEASVRAIRWRFIPPSAPFMGGAWERLVRSVKTALEVTLRERAPTDEVLQTLLTEAEHTINSRPLTHVSMAADDPEALTPNHFLLGGSSRVPLPGAFNERDAANTKTWRVSQALADMFWSRWVREYLPELQHRREPHAKQGAIQLGDLVFIADGTLPRNQWPRGEVVATFPGPDGEIRAVDVRTNRGVLRRPTKKLAILRINAVNSKDTA